MPLFRPQTWDSAIWACVNTYNEYNIPSNLAGKVVVDVGAHIGSFSHLCASRGAQKVMGYEAYRPNWALSNYNTAEYYPRVLIRPFGLWRSDQPAQRIGFSPSSEPINTGGGNVWSQRGSEMVTVIPADGEIRRMGFVDILKLDCEGSEWPILLTSQELGRVGSILGEYHEFGGEYDTNTIPERARVDGYDRYTIDVLQSYLESKGFCVKHERSRGSDGQLCSLGHFWATRP